MTAAASVAAARWRMPESVRTHLVDPIAGFTPERVDVRDEEVSIHGAMSVPETANGFERLPAVIGQHDGRTFVRVSPVDPELPELRELLRPDSLARIGRHVGGAGARTTGVRILAHRFGRRACFRLTLQVRHRPVDLLGKVFARHGHDQLTATLTALERGRSRIPADIPAVRLHDRTRRLVVSSWIPGDPVHSQLPESLLDVASSIGRAVRAYQGTPATHLSVYGLRDELATIRKFVGRVAVVRPDLAGLLASGAEAFDRIVETSDCATLVFAHRDLHDKQIVRAGSDIGIIDWDWAAAAPPGLDPGNFLAHLHLRSLQRRITANQALYARRAFLAGYRDGRGTDPPHLETWERLALLRLAAVYGLRPSWPGLAEELLLASGGPR